MSRCEAELLRVVVPWAHLETYHGQVMSSSATESQGAAIVGGLLSAASGISLHSKIKVGDRIIWV